MSIKHCPGRDKTNVDRRSWDILRRSSRFVMRCEMSLSRPNCSCQKSLPKAASSDFNDSWENDGDENGVKQWATLGYGACVVRGYTLVSTSTVCCSICQVVNTWYVKTATALWMQRWKNIQNLSTFAKVIAKIKVTLFLRDTVTQRMFVSYCIVSKI